MRKLFILASLIPGLLLCACHKESNHAGNTTASPTNAAYKIITQTQNSTSVLVWDSGYLSVDTFSMHAVNDSFANVQFVSKVAQGSNIFSPLSVSCFNMDPGHYKKCEYSMALRSSGSSPAFFLTGSYMATDMKVIVNLVINEPIALKVPWDSTVVVEHNHVYTTMLAIDLSRLVTGITSNMLNAAEMVQGTITISASSNTDLYEQIVSNLNDMMQCSSVDKQ